MQEARCDANGTSRLDRLASLLSEALARRLGHGQPIEPIYSALPLDYPTVVSPTTDALSTVPTEGDL
jgi:hypothetical protein